METNKDPKEWWAEWFQLPQTQLYLEQLKGMKQEMFESTLSQPPEHRSDTIAGIIGVQGAIDLLLLTKGGEKNGRD